MENFSIFSLVQIRDHLGSIECAVFSPNGKYLASGSSCKTISVWRVSSAELIKTLTGHKSRVSSVVFSPNGEYLASGSHD